MLRRFLSAYGLLTGGIIGAGVFGLPASAVRSGLLPFAIEGLLVVAVAWILLALFAEVVLGTEGRHRIPGYAEAYLGPPGKTAAVFSNVFGLFGALLAYLISGGVFLQLLLAPFVEITAAQAALLYFAMGAALIYKGIGKVAVAEIILVALFLLTLAGLGIESRAAFSWEHFRDLGSAGETFLPYGVFLFAFWGMSLIPDTAEQAGMGRGVIRPVIAAGTLTAVIVYAAFVLLVVGVTGSDTSPEALRGLAELLGPGAVSLGLVFGLFTTFSSFLALGLVLQETLAVDFRFPRLAAWTAAMFVPLGLYLSGLRAFVEVLGITGAVFLGVEGLIVLLVAWRFSRSRDLRGVLFHPLLLSLLAVALTSGVILELLSVLR